MGSSVQRRRAVFRRGSAPAAAALALVLMLWSAGNGAGNGAGHEHPAPTVLAPGYSQLEFELPGPGTYTLPPLGAAADGAVIDSARRPRSLHDLMGDKVVVLSFIFTRCSDVNGCPLATFVLKGVQNRVLAASDLKDHVRLLSLSFDPDYDTPEVLDAYASRFRAADFDWHFLTTRADAELAPILDDYDQWIIRDYDSNGEYLGTISHLLRVYLIDRDKRIRNIYSTSFLHSDTVANDIRTLLEHRSPGPSP